MAKIVVSGGGICGLGASMMLARRGHEVTVLERNPEEPPESIDKAWDAWERPGVAQFRMGHYFLARFHKIIGAELPELFDRFDQAGALRITPAIDAMPDSIADRSPRPDDDQFRVITGRRPVFEWAVANAAAAEPRVDVRRGVAVTELLTGASVEAGIPHVVGVRTDAGDDLHADLVIDAGGRRSAFGTWLAAIGGKPFFEHSEDSGFRYYGRYFRAGPNGWPGPQVPMIQVLGSVALLSLPADNDTWMIGVVTSATDKALYKLTDADAWRRVVAATPAIAPYLDGEPISELETMAAIPDRYRRFIIDGAPVATGITAIADAVAATNPMRGRGVSMGMLHAQAVINEIDALDDPVDFARRVDAASEAELLPHFHATVEMDRDMRTAFDREVKGEAPPPPPAEEDPIAAMQAKFFSLIPSDPDVWRGFMKIVNVLDQPFNIVASEPVLSKVLAYDGPIIHPLEGDGPARQELVDIAAGAKSVAARMTRWDDLDAAN
ncbi:MAG TPA: NAD-binding protein [Acidimicrobiales bacterium]|nr:NAD-binding protein [Acidimicrobiales bacterium]